MSHLDDLSGRRFGRLVALRLCESPKSSQDLATWWLCQCDCGVLKPARAGHLKRGGVSSCGCLRRENLSVYPATHRQTGFPTWHSWRGMCDRCTHENHSSWARYGGRGIKVCDRWLGSEGFKNFLSDMGERPQGLTLDRIDSDGDYRPGNCRWATTAVQRRNSSRVRLLTFKGKTQCLSDWAIELGIGRNAIMDRLKKGWSVEDALGKPPRKNRRNL